jgi:isopenicillin N synthase-like dioxygenase
LQRLPVIDIGSENLCAVAREFGSFYLQHPLFPAERCAFAIEAARVFFAMRAEAKRALGIEGSPHFRGYSEMKNERDWREQIHFGREEEAVVGGAVYDALRGPNLWPADLFWKEMVMELMADLERVGRDVLRHFGELMGEEERAYLLLKMIQYHAAPEGVARPGVAAHVDFSWVTLLLQDTTGGLEVCTPGGEWMAAEPRAGTLLVNLGEILQFASCGYFQATPHRVTTGARERISLPFFLNPSLDTVVPAGLGGGHVHRVLRPAPLHFGEEEWKRKGLGVWCAECC